MNMKIGIRLAFAALSAMLMWTPSRAQETGKSPVLRAEAVIKSAGAAFSAGAPLKLDEPPAAPTNPLEGALDKEIVFFDKPSFHGLPFLAFTIAERLADDHSQALQRIAAERATKVCRKLGYGKAVIATFDTTIYEINALEIGADMELAGKTYPGFISGVVRENATNGFLTGIGCNSDSGKK